MTHVVATINLKGGVGKTTTTAALAEMLSGEFGQRVLLIDLDPQTNLTIMMIGEQRWGELDAAGGTLATLFEVALGDRPGPVDVSTLIQRQVSALPSVTSVDLLPSSLRLIGLQDRITDIADGPTEVLARALKPVLVDYDYVLIDCPPNLGAMTLNGLRLADAYLIPTIPDVMSTYGIGPVQERVRQFADEWGTSIVELGVVVTKYRKASAVHRNTVDDLNRNRQISMVFPSLIPEANQIAAAAEYADFGTLHKKYGNDGQFAALRDLAQDFIATTKVRLAWQ
ncbi:CobQ/CobB/MinD/ParA nucleotide binding domain protein [Rhodococcus sp. RD6.2]|uniref:ParA family protein n=1 Tax=Rhodococcus sp. RD6.2 TaxID=260936 RepID=UPI00063B25B1|nr:ParA family protein [Rhodococcus sp. RD6.2]CRK50443.1 CobQ/CobB/MinD/ParA nucleotide binding domain protein [Rhodococcus sp. RD6.2]